MKKAPISKTSRILSVFHLFRYCSEVSYREITGLMQVSTKTATRDIALLRQTDVIRIRYSKAAGAFVPLDGNHPVNPEPVPDWPDYKPLRLYLEKILRLTTLMRELDVAYEPAAWYRTHYPTLCVRTMQRDFAELRKLGYRVIYQRETDLNGEHPIGSYYCDFPYDTYSLDTFYR
jgi:hypothetical protein